jgi:hypothetical protein
MADIIYGATGINFAAHGNVGGMASELLDDYEEGDFTATLTSATPPSTPPTVTSEYTKIGNFCYFNMHRFDNANTSGGSGHMKVTGLPFTSYESCVVVMALTQGFDFDTSYRQLWTLYDSELNAYESRSGTSWTVWNITAGTAKYMVVSGTYRTS